MHASSTRLAFSSVRPATTRTRASPARRPPSAPKSVRPRRLKLPRPKRLQRRLLPRQRLLPLRPKKPLRKIVFLVIPAKAGIQSQGRQRPWLWILGLAQDDSLGWAMPAPEWRFMRSLSVRHPQGAHDDPRSRSKNSPRTRGHRRCQQ
ncbi:hypothetical protein SPHINGO391_530005 [Sphingomonas aurantiaca]|uniref:Uncharacterized protein n=1 Tax=Sphingomonas aurantiaca TaxID=185949 RepID=A0A5E8AKC3_9SPHN|nr:hypothetical protein SPHINGO391_530005 [Sphingomonas aurantiaca]